jgi:hypothetical protein
MFAGDKIKMIRKTTSHEKRIKIGGMIGDNQGRNPLLISGELGRCRPLCRSAYAAIPEDPSQKRHNEDPQESPYQKMKIAIPHQSQAVYY